MGSKPDIWMPVYVGDYLADTCHLNAEEHGCYFLMLMHQWRVGHFSEQSIPAITRGASSTAQAAVKQMLSTDQAGLFYSSRLDREKEAWTEKKGTYVKRASAGGRAKAEKYASSSASSTTKAVLEVCTSPSPSPIEVQKPSRAKTARAEKPRKPVEPEDAKEPTKTDIAKKRHADFKAAIKNYWDAKNPGIDMPWGAMEGSQLDQWLREAPHITLDQFIGFLHNRFRSKVNHGDRPCQWIKWITSYGPGPVNQYKNTENGENGNGTNQQHSPAKQRVDGNLRAIGEALAARGVPGPWSPARANGEEVSESGTGGVDGGIPGGLRATEHEILPPES